MPHTTEIYAANIDGAGTNLRWNKYVPSTGGPTWPVIVLFHVGGYKTGDRDPQNGSVAQACANAGYLTFAADYRLAPSGSRSTFMPDQADPPSDGRPPQQTNDCLLACLTARAHAQCNGRMVVWGGSAGGEHGLWTVANGVAGTSRPDAFVGWSGTYDNDDAGNLANVQFRDDIVNYINVAQADPGFTAAAKAASAYWQTGLDTTTVPIMLMNSDNETITTSMWTRTMARLGLTGTHLEGFIRTGTEHAFIYWNLGYGGAFPTCIEAALDFTNRVLTPTPLPVSANHLVTDTLTVTSGGMPLDYPIGMWGQYGAGTDIPAGVVSNKGLVGIGVSEDWDIIESVAPISGVHQYDWHTLDAKIAQTIAAGLKVNLIITNSSDNTPQWLKDQEALANPSQVIDLIDPASNHSTYCQPIKTVVYWNAVLREARVALATAAGARYSSNDDIVAVTVQFANHNSNDWNIQDNVNLAPDFLQCPDCPQTPPRLCGPIELDQPAQWLAAGWTEPLMVEVGIELMDAYAAAFHRQNLKLPIGGIEDRLGSEGRVGGGDYSAMARDMENLIYGNSSLGIPAKLYAHRFWLQRNIVDATWGNGYDNYDPASPTFAIPGTGSANYIKYMIYKHAQQTGTTPRHAGLQMVAAATGMADDCRLGGRAGGPCGYPVCPDLCVINAAIAEAWSYNVAYIEVFPQDSMNTAFATVYEDQTTLMGGTVRP